jgi:transcription antitermination factor NusG
MPWYAIYTKARNEKKVADELNKRGIIAYCPLLTQVKQWSDRKKKIEVPLISSYVFVQVEDKEREKVFAVNGVVRYLYWLGKPAIVRDDEIMALQNAMQSSFTSATVNALKPGDKITIPSGPFEGQKGTVQTVKSNKLQIVLPQLGFVITLVK